MIEKVLYPGLWLMRQWSLATKLIVIALLSAAPALALLAGLGDDFKSFGLIALWLYPSAIVSSLYLLFAFYRTFNEDLQQLTRMTKKLCQGDLQARVTIDDNIELAALAASLSQIAKSQSAMVANLRSNAAFIAYAGKNLAMSNRELSERTEQQASNLEQTTASTEELSTTVDGNAQAASNANDQAASVRDIADKGAATMQKAVESVEAIQNSTKRMDEIVGVIDGIAFQTNILALNAAVEAARAGESGRGFAVVASEVRSLAQRSAESAKEIRQLIGASSQQVASSVDHIRIAGGNIIEIVSGIRDVATNMAQISNSNIEQSTGLTEITAGIRQLDEITQENAQMVEQAVRHATDLEVRASALVESVAMYKLSQGAPEEAIALVELAVNELRRSASVESGLAEITNRPNGFYDRDMYVFAFNRAGAYVAFGGNPAKLGVRVQDIPGIDGAGLLRAIYEQVERGPGWVEYDIANPTTGRIQAKMSYVTAFGELAIGCGVYKNYDVS